MLNLQGIISAIYVFISCFCLIIWTCSQGFSCTVSCPENCKDGQCHPGDGSCNGCEIKFWGQFCNLSCSALCDSGCDQFHGYCYDCIAGRWMENCTQLCPGYCDNQACDVKTGICDNGCIAGYYGYYCNQTCSPGCPYCKRESGACPKCNPGYYGTFCDIICPLHCKGDCNKATGECYECFDESWGLNCSEKCEHRCECDQLTGNCTKCRPGFCGQTCEKTCPYDVSRCTNGVCERDTCECSTCENQTHTGKNCEQTCPYPCNTCTINGTCKSCLSESKRYGPDCMKECIKCQSDCDFFTGYCQECLNGSFGEKCEKVCPANCKLCDKTTGQCFECLAGFWGVDCTEMCPENCHLRVCDKHSGYCLACTGHVYGTKCEKFCGSHCMRKDYDKNREICDGEGVCLHQCEIGWWGPKCEDACMNCSASKCNHDTGVCEFGCLSGFEANRTGVCKAIASNSTQSEHVTSEENQNGLAIAAIVLPSITIVIVGINFFCLCCLQRKSKDMLCRMTTRQYGL